ncbi:polymeric immunoglobulin receptor-like isoform X6 [Xiphophorus couchianus]|uniref:polymeric immunoglobulin receptor-like isoform X6 n=1 Tax=Xiphophorus couchianus TaxID=32473 RepID=UPI001015D620|nr:polymeric immunoglobulin receptor-like isoform X6 [Xiphophorus couchianus]
MTSWETQQQETIMMARLSSLCLVFLSLQVRCSSTVETLSHYGVSGGNTTFSCIFLSSGRIKFFCRETCEGENLLIRTSDGAAQIGRYRTEYVREASRTFSVLSVSISELTRSDAGRYRCGLGDSSSSASFQDFRLVVVDDLLDGNKHHHIHRDAGSSLTVACSFGSSGLVKSLCRGECGDKDLLVETDGVGANKGRYSIKYDGETSGAVLLVTVTQLTQSDSGRYRCVMDRTSDLYRDFSLTVTDAADPSGPTPTTQSFSSNVPVVVGVTLAAMVVLIPAALLVSCRRRSLRESRGSSSGSNSERTTSTLKGFYQNLSPATRDQNQIYCSLENPNKILISVSEPQE